MRDEDRSREELLRRIAALRRRLARLEAAASDRHPEPRPGDARPQEGGQQPSSLHGSEYAQVEDDLVRQRAFFRQVIDMLPDMVFVKDSQSRYLLANRGLAEAYGTTPEQMVGKTDAELGGLPRETSSFQHDDLEVLQTGRDKVIPDEPFTMSSGEVHYYQTTKRPLADENGEVARILAVSVDITERKAREEALQRAEEELWQTNAELAATRELAQAGRQRYRELFDLAPDGYLVTDAAGAIREANEAAGRLLGLQPAALVGTLLGSFLQDRDAQRLPALLGEIERSPLCAREWRVRVFPNRREPLDVSLTAALGREGQSVVLRWLLRDISAYVEVEQALRQANERLTDTLNSITDAYVAFDREWRFLEINPVAEEQIFGARPARELLGKVFWEEYPPAMQTEFYRQYHIALAEGHSVHFEAQSRINSKWWETHAYPRGGRLDVYMRDVTGRKHGEAELRAANELLEARVAERTAELEDRAEQLRLLARELTQAEQRERHELAHVLHDELQQFLVAARLSLRGLQRKLEDTLQLQTAQQVDNLLGEAIQVSRSLTSRLAPPALHELGLAAGLDWLARWIQENHGLVVDLQLDSQGDPQVGEIRLLLFQCVRELLLNAVKYAGVGRARVTMQVLDAHQLCVEVSDAGAGFDVQQVLADRKLSGGFGLFSVRERLRLLGGEMEVQSAPGCGTRIALRVPLRHEAEGALVEAREGTVLAEGAPVTALQGVSLPSTPAAERRIRVLLADDHALMRRGLIALLEQEGDIEVVGEAGDGQQAVDLARKLAPDVVVMDVSMPRSGGIEATRRILGAMPQVRVIGLTVHVEPTLEAAMRAAGAADYLLKEEAPEVLLAAIRGTPLSER